MILAELNPTSFLCPVPSKVLGKGVKGEEPEFLRVGKPTRKAFSQISQVKMSHWHIFKTPIRKCALEEEDSKCRKTVSRLYRYYRILGQKQTVDNHSW